MLTCCKQKESGMMHRLITSKSKKRKLQDRNEKIIYMYLVCKDSWFVRTSSMRGPLVWQNSWFVRTNGMWGNYVRSKLQSGMKRSTTSGMQGQLVSEDNWYVRTEDFCGQLVYMWGQQVCKNSWFPRTKFWYVKAVGLWGQSRYMQGMYSTCL